MPVVILTHYFPPIGGPGARRMLGWVNGFHAAGEKTTVVTPEAHPRDPYYQPGETYSGPASVFSPPIFDPARFARGDSESQSDSSPTSEKRGLGARLRPWLLLPDQRRLANRPLVGAALQAIGEEVDNTLVLTSSPYNSIHLAGLSLKKRLGKRITWIADFRDDWFHPVFFPFPNAVYRAYNRWLEGKVLRKADGLTVVSKRTLEKVRSRHDQHFASDWWQFEADSKWRWAPNGFDSTGVESILNAAVEPQAGPIRLHFSGTLWQNHPVNALVSAMATVGRNSGRKFRFDLVGRVIQELPETPDPAALEITTRGWQPYEESLAETRQADLLLVHTGPESQDIKIKVFDAAAARRPVLILGPEDSATVKLVREHVADPLVADQDDADSIACALNRYLDSEDKSLHAFNGLPEEYDRVKQASSLLAWSRDLAGH